MTIHDVAVATSPDETSTTDGGAGSEVGAATAQIVQRLTPRLPWETQQNRQNLTTWIENATAVA